MSIKERFYDTLWFYDNHSKDDETKNTLIRDSFYYIEDLEAQVMNLEAQVMDLEIEVDFMKGEVPWC